MNWLEKFRSVRNVWQIIKRPINTNSKPNQCTYLMFPWSLCGRSHEWTNCGLCRNVVVQNERKERRFWRANQCWCVLRARQISETDQRRTCKRCFLPPTRRCTEYESLHERFYIYLCSWVARALVLRCDAESHHATDGVERTCAVLPFILFFLPPKKLLLIFDSTSSYLRYSIIIVACFALRKMCS